MATREGRKTRWEEACEAVASLAPAICKADPDGVTVWFFSNAFECEENVKGFSKFLRVLIFLDGNRVNQLFKRHSPGGSTDLAGVLRRVRCQANVY